MLLPMTGNGYQFARSEPQKMGSRERNHEGRSFPDTDRSHRSLAMTIVGPWASGPCFLAFTLRQYGSRLIMNLMQPKKPPGYSARKSGPKNLLLTSRLPVNVCPCSTFLVICLIRSRSRKPNQGSLHQWVCRCIQSINKDLYPS